MDECSRGWRMRLQRALESSGISYRALAEKTGLNYTTVQGHLSGTHRMESLTFIRQVCKVVGMPVAEAVFGSRTSEDGLLQVPLLSGKDPVAWVDGSEPEQPPETWLPCPMFTTGGLRTFVWQLTGSELAPDWPAGGMVYIDPDQQPSASGRHLVMAELENGELMVRWREIIAGEQWLVPERAIYQAVPLGSGRIVGLLIGGFKTTATV